MNRRRFNALALAGLGLPAVPSLGLPPAAWAMPNSPDRKNSPNEKTAEELITPEARRAIERGLTFLQRRQVKNGRNRGAMGNSGMASGVATTSMTGLAFMCQGSAPGQGRYGKNCDMCVEFIMGQTQDSGYIARKDNTVHENMYGHGFSMLFLSQAYGMTQKAEIGDKLRSAVKLTCQSQNNQGGWRYQPRKSDADLSITVCQIMGLRGARDAGIDVPDDVRTKCIEYVQRSQNADGSFRYTMSGGHKSLAMTAAGVTSLYSAGIYEGDGVMNALKFIKSSGVQGGGHFFYTNYYAVQAMWHAGGEYWNDWYPKIRDYLIKNQSGDGSWASSEAGPPFGAAMACIILQMPLNLVPVFSP